MTLKQYIILMTAASLMCWASVVLVIVNVDPYMSTTLLFTFFYMSVFLSLCGTLSLIIFSIYAFFTKKIIPLYKIVQKSFRDSIIISLAATFLLFLQSQRLINWLSTSLLLILSIGLFIFFMSNERRIQSTKV